MKRTSRNILTRRMKEKEGRILLAVPHITVRRCGDNDYDDDDDDDDSSLSVASFVGETFDDEVIMKQKEKEDTGVDTLQWEHHDDDKRLLFDSVRMVDRDGAEKLFVANNDSFRALPNYDDDFTPLPWAVASDDRPPSSQQHLQQRDKDCWFSETYVNPLQEDDKIDVQSHVFDRISSHDHHLDDEEGVFRSNNSTNNNMIPFSTFSIFSQRRLPRTSRRMRYFVWTILLVCVILTMLIVSVMVIHSSMKEVSFPIQEMPSPTTTPTVMPILTQQDFANDDDIPPSFRFHHDWTKADAVRNVKNDYSLHPLLGDDEDVRITIMTPHSSNDNVTLYLVTDDGPLLETTLTATSCQDTWPTANTMTVLPQTLVKVSLPPRGIDTQVVACVNDAAVASALHLYVTNTNKELSWETNYDYQIQTINFASLEDDIYPGYHSELDIFQQDEEDHLYLLMFTRQAVPNVIFVPDTTSKEFLNDMLTEHPYRAYHCDGTGYGFWSHDVTRVIKGETAQPHSQLVLWDVSVASQGQHIWSTILWECDITTNHMQRPAVYVTVENAPL